MALSDYPFVGLGEALERHHAARKIYDAHRRSTVKRVTPAGNSQHDDPGLRAKPPEWMDPLPMLLLQPVVQYYANVGARTGHALVFGFRAKIEF